MYPLIELDNPMSIYFHSIGTKFFKEDCSDEYLLSIAPKLQKLLADQYAKEKTKLDKVVAVPKSIADYGRKDTRYVAKRAIKERNPNPTAEDVKYFKDTTPIRAYDKEVVEEKPVQVGSKPKTIKWF